jgi:hypothetical protein
VVGGSIAELLSHEEVCPVCASVGALGVDSGNDKRHFERRCYSLIVVPKRAVKDGRFRELSKLKQLVEMTRADAFGLTQRKP